MEKIELRIATQDDLPTLWDIAIAMGAAKDDGYFDKSLEFQQQGHRIVFIASVAGQDVGYGMLAWVPKYAFFRKLGIAEIQDLNVLSEYRRRGIASMMIEKCENLAREKGHEYIGIGVGLDASYGAAQQLYVQRGYVPDGNGVTYDRKTLVKGDFKPIDDDMSLMLIKSLQI